ncbi:resuscitation-promoting factor [Haloechinothrix salitolerans]
MTVDQWRAPLRPERSSVAQLDRPTTDFHWPEYDADIGEFSPSPAVTPQDVHAVLGPQAEAMLRDLDVDVDELIRLVNAETTVLPVIPDYIPDDIVEAYAPAREPEPEESGLATAIRTWKQRFLKGAVVAVLVSLTGGGAAALAMNKSVTLNVDGKTQTVNTFGSTVGDVLDDAGITIGKHDALSPSPNAAVGHGGVVQLERGRQLTLIVDGKQRETWVRATTVEEAMKQLDMGKMLSNGAVLSAPRDGSVPLDGMTLEVKTQKDITLFDGGNKPRTVTTNAVTVKEFLATQEIKLGERDSVEKGLKRKLVDGAELRIVRTGVSTINIKEPIEPPVKTIEDPEMPAGTEKVKQQGKAGEKLVTYRVTRRNNVEVSREELEVKVLSKAVPRIVIVGTKQLVISDAAVWDRLAFCESSGNWSINTGNGYYGGLQFNKQTWDAYGGGQYAAYPHQASREQQIAIATKLRDARNGYSAWPHCAQKLGLPT